MTPKKYSPRFILPGPVGAGGLLIFDPIRLGSPPLKIRLKGRHARFIRVLARHWRHSLDDLDTFIPVSRIAKELYDEHELAPAPGEEAVRAYAAQINRLIRAATPLGMEAPKLHEGARLLGYRLIEKLEI